MKARIFPLGLAKGQMPGATWALPLSLTFLTFTLGVPARSQEPPHPEESIADAARNARQHRSSSPTPPKIFTNDDLGVQSSLSGAAEIPPESPPKQAEVTTSQAADCNNSDDDEKLKTELQTAQEELDRVHSELSYDPKVISDGDVDLKNFKPGSSGLAFGSPPLFQSEPQAPARVNEVILEERITSLKEASHIACDSPKDAEIQKKLDSAKRELELLQRQFDLDKAAYYSKPNYAEDTTGKARIDAEQEQILSLQSDIERLRGELPSPNPN